jgi:signal transduction histidine kinase
VRPASTLRGRLALVALAATTAWVAVLGVAFNAALASWLRHQADTVARTRAAAVAATAVVGPGGRIALAEPPDDEALDLDVWVYQGGRAIERAAAPAELWRAADRLAGRGGGFAQTTGSTPARLYAEPVRYGPHRVGTVVAGVRLDPYRGVARSILLGSIGLAVLLLGGVYAVTRAAVRRALAPVGEMTARAARWSAQGAAERFGARRRPAELELLAANLDALLDRLAVTLRRERNQAAELSHELRTPLARIIAEVDWLTVRPRSVGDRRASHETIAGAAESMRQICETLLSEVRTRDGGASGRCSLTELAHALAAGCPDAPVVVVRGAEVRAGVPRSVAERVVRPLLDNARRYAPHTVTLECGRAETAVCVTVSDDGPGVPAAVGDAVFEAGRRADPDDGHDGAGLGLALARRLARAAGGDVTLVPASRGAVFVVTLPAG